jgi:LETM1 and EF-hand domain-containing protein 1
MTQRARSAGTPLSRAETRFIRTYKQDVLKLVPFILIAVVLEEIIPLLVLYAPGMLPSTCILPSQRARITRARREGQRAFAALGMYLEPLRKQGAPQGYVPLAAAGGPSLQALCGCAPCCCCAVSGR